MLKDRIAGTLRRASWTQAQLAVRLNARQGDVSKYLHGSEPRGQRYMDIITELDRIDAALAEPGFEEYLQRKRAQVAV